MRTTSTGPTTTTIIIITTIIVNETPAADAVTLSPLLRLLHLASPALPVGAFAYSQGLEYAVHAGWVKDEETAAAWILGLLEHAQRFVEVPLLRRLHTAWWENDSAAVHRWSDFLFATRGSHELQTEDRRLGSALARVLSTLDVPEAAPWVDAPRTTYVGMFALAAARWGIPLPETASALLFSWCENQVAAALRLVPLGQSSGVRILGRAGALIPAVVAQGLALEDDELALGAPGLSLSSALHEVMYSRIFRS